MTVAAAPPASGARLLVISHPAVVTANQCVYAELCKLGWDVHIVVPARWRHEYSAKPFSPQPLPALAERLLALPVLGAGLAQRHVYLARVVKVLRRIKPDLAFLEQEPFSVSALQWGLALMRAGVPFGVQSDENLDRVLPLPARLIQRLILPRAAFVAARSPTAAALVARHVPACDVRVIPHAVPEWPRASRRNDGRFTVGFAGRLVAEKGIDTLTSAAAQLGGTVRLRLYGDGPLRRQIEGNLPRDQDAEIVSGLAHERMAEAFADMDVLVLPSRTTPTWAEQFGRVLVEALWCGVPVVGSDSGEIPWVIEATGGGLVFPEGDSAALAERLTRLRDDPELCAELASRGRRAVEARFSATAAARAFDDQLRNAIGC